MHCGQCNHDVELLVPVMVHGPGRVYWTEMCQNCGWEIGAICAKHDVPTIGFQDRSRVCLECVNVLAEEALEAAQRILFAANHDWPSRRADFLRHWLSLVSSKLNRREDLCLARAIAIFALRNPSRLPIDRIVEYFLAAKNADELVTPMI